MGRDIHVRIVQLNRETNQYEEVVLYRKNKQGEMAPVYAYDARHYELFEILDGDNCDYFPYIPVYTENLPARLKEEIEECKDIDGYYNFYEANLADIKIYLHNHPKVRDYDWDNEDTFEKEGWKDNPVKYFIECIERYLGIADVWWFGEQFDSNIRIIYWFDC